MQRLMLDPSKWTYADYAAFLAAIAANQLEKALDLIMLIIIGWSYDVPLTPNAYMELPLTEFPSIIKSVRETLEEAINNLDTSDVKVNLDKWNMRDFFNFRKAAAEGDVAEVERLMRKVCKLEGVTDETKQLSFEQGALMSRAISEKSRTLFAAGN